jgi:hypothetical protein
LPSLLSLVVVLGAIGFTGARLSAAATGAAAMMFGLGVDGVVLLYVAHRLALAERADTNVPRRLPGRRAACCSACGRRRRPSMGLLFVDFSEPAAARAPAGAQHDGVRRPHAGDGAGAPAAPPAAACRAGAADAAAGALARTAAPVSCSRRPSR